MVLKPGADGGSQRIAELWPSNKNAARWSTAVRRRPSKIARPTLQCPSRERADELKLHDVHIGNTYPRYKSYAQYLRGRTNYRSGGALSAYHVKAMPGGMGAAAPCCSTSGKHSCVHPADPGRTGTGVSVHAFEAAVLN